MGTEEVVYPCNQLSSNKYIDYFVVVVNVGQVPKAQSVVRMLVGEEDCVEFLDINIFEVFISIRAGIY